MAARFSAPVTIGEVSWFHDHKRRRELRALDEELRVTAAWIAATEDGPHRRLSDQDALDVLHRAVRERSPVRSSLWHPCGILIMFEHGAVDLVGASTPKMPLIGTQVRDVAWSDTAATLTFTRRGLRSRTQRVVADAVRTRSHPSRFGTDDMFGVSW